MCRRDGTIWFHNFNADRSIDRSIVLFGTTTTLSLLLNVVERIGTREFRGISPQMERERFEAKSAAALFESRFEVPVVISFHRRHGQWCYVGVVWFYAVCGAVWRGVVWCVVVRCG